jgi:hypothetical protein
VSASGSAVERAKVAYAVALTLGSFSWGVFYTFSTRYLVAELGGGLLSMYLFTGSSWLFTLLTLLADAASRTLGERLTILTGALVAVPVLLGACVREPLLLALLLASVSAPWSISWPVVLKVVFSRVESGEGGEYSAFTVFSGISYFAGSLSAGLLYALGGVGVVYTTTALLLVASFTLYYAYYTPSSTSSGESPAGGRLVGALKYTLTAICVFVLGRELFFAYVPVKINRELEALLPSSGDLAYYVVYGLVYSGGALVSPLARVLAGRLVDKYGPRGVLVASISGYALLYWLFAETSGVVPLVLWQVPLFPLYDVAVNTHIARLLPRELHVQGFALLTAFTALGGSLVTLLLALRVVDTALVGLVVTAATLTSITLLLCEERVLEHVRVN